MIFEMGEMKMLVLCALVAIAMCEEISKPQMEHDTFLDRRFKRETEIDPDRPREYKFPVGRRPTTRPSVPLTKRVNSINVLPRKVMGPVVLLKPKTLNPTLDQPAEKVQEKKISGGDVLDCNESNESSDVTDVSKTDNDTDNDKEIDDEVVMTTKDIPGASEIPTTENETTSSIIKSDVLEVQNKTESIPLKEEVTQNNKNKNNENVQSKEINTKNVQSKPKLAKTPAIVPETKIPQTKSIKNMDIEEPIQKLGSPEEKTKDLSNEVDNDTPASASDLKTEIIAEPPKQTREKVAPKLVPATKVKSKKIPINTTPRVNPLLVSIAPKTSSDVTELKSVDDDNKNALGKPKPGLSNSLQTDPEEILIQNNNYEELYETTPQIISSEFREAPNWINYNGPTFDHIKTNDPEIYVANKPYSYNVEKYPNQFEINMYGDTDSRSYANVDNVNSNTSNQIINPKNNNMWSWGPRYNSCYQPQYQNVDFRSGYDISQRQGYPKRIWRSWNNKQIFIRPKYGDAAGKKELYNGLGVYLANANAQSTPPYIFNRVSSSVENQNTSPCWNSFQYKRYGC